MSAISQVSKQLTPQFAQQFISFEGLDGAGKSTLIKLLKAELEKHHQSVTLTREPGGTALGDELRQILLRKEGDIPTSRTELLLYEAIRAQHVEKLIKPKLAVGEWVLCDRFSASSIAFQAGGRKISEEEVQWLNAFATENLAPSLTVLLDLTYEEAQNRQTKRVHQQNEAPDRMESEARDFHERVRESFLKQARESKESKEKESENQMSGNKTKWIILSAMQTPENLLQELIKQMREHGVWEY